MKPSELYIREPEKVVYPFDAGDGSLYLMIDYFMGSRYNHLADDINPHQISKVLRSTQVKIHVHKDFNFDGRRFWRLLSVWYIGKPVCVLQNAGRKGDDYSNRFVTDERQFAEMVRHIRTLFIFENEELDDVVDVDEDILLLAEFYGNSLDGFFGRY